MENAKIDGKCQNSWIVWDREFVIFMNAYLVA